MKPEDLWAWPGRNPGLESDCFPAAYATAWNGLDKGGPLANGFLLNGNRWRNMPLGIGDTFFNLKPWKEACHLLMAYTYSAFSCSPTSLPLDSSFPCWQHLSLKLQTKIGIQYGIKGLQFPIRLLLLTNIHIWFISDSFP